MRRRLLGLFILFILFLQSPAFAYLAEIQIMDKLAITKLNDEELIEAYINALVELDAIRIFHQTSGFNPKEYSQYKSIVRYRIDLLREIKKRKLEIPVTDQELQTTTTNAPPNTP